MTGKLQPKRLSARSNDEGKIPVHQSPIAGGLSPQQTGECVMGWSLR